MTGTKSKTSKSELNAMAEIALMGKVVQPKSNEDALKICDYIVTVIRNTIAKVSDDYKVKLEEITESHKIIGVSVSRVDDMIMINLPLDEPLDNIDANFGYVLNLTAPYFSEYGYSAYRKRNNFWYRVS